MASSDSDSGEVQEWDQNQLALFERDTRISELEMEKEFLEGRVKKLTEGKRILLEERDELVVEVEGTREYIANARADRKMAVWLALSWIFFASVLVAVLAVILGR